MKKIKCYVKRPDSLPYTTYLSDSLENLQRFVGGHIEVVSLTSDMVVICNEEGRIRNLPPCGYVYNHLFVGPIIFCGVKGEEFDDVPISFKTFKAIFANLWEEIK